MSRLRSLCNQAIYREGGPLVPANFTIPNLATAPGRQTLDLYAATQARVKAWNVSVSGTINTDGPLFSALTNVSGSTSVAIVPGVIPPEYGTEKQFAYGAEIYPIRETRGGNYAALTATSSLAMIGAGIVQQPDAPGSLGDLGGVSMTGPTLSGLYTKTTAGIEAGAALFDLTMDFTTTAPDTGPGTRFYFVRVHLQTSPNGKTLDGGGVSVPQLVGGVSINVPDWLLGGTNSYNLPLYADYPLDDTTGLNVVGSSDYAAGQPTGSVNIIMTPAECWPYEDSNGVSAWDNDGNLLISFAALAFGEP